MTRPDSLALHFSFVPHTGELPYLSVTPTTLFGIALMAFGTCMRLRSYEALGPLFTFDLCIKPEHQLVTSGPYSFVRPTPRISRFALSHDKFDIRGVDSWELDHKMRGWVEPQRCDVCYAVRVDLVSLRIL